MAINVIMPQMGADMTEGTLVRWAKQIGQQVNRGDIIAEIETDKATVELEAFDSGILRATLVEEGAVVPVGTAIAVLGSAEEVVEGAPAPGPRAAAAERRIEPARGTASAPTPQVAPARPSTGERHDHHLTPDGRIRISPVARRIAEDAGVDIATVAGTGPDGRILRRDVEAAIRGQKPVSTPVPEPAPAPRPAPAPLPSQAGPAVAAFELVPLTRMRTAIARRMSQSKQQQPHYYLTLDIDMTEALAFRAKLNELATGDDRVSINDLVVKAVAIALGRHPKFNAEYTEAGIRMYSEKNIDIAIALDDGLIAPCLLDVANKTLGAIARESRDLVARAKSGHLHADELSKGTFSITNLGNFGVETLIGIIKPPQAAILGVGSVLVQAVVRDGAIVARQMMKVALSADHRVTDGAEGARFIKEVQALLENPVSLAL
jgi:pyruvate dehydrogenase E2 component (dihydrolipoamide acetyltransferase)